MEKTNPIKTIMLPNRTAQNFNKLDFSNLYNANKENRSDMPEKTNKRAVEGAIRPMGIPCKEPMIGGRKLSGTIGNPVVNPINVNNPYMLIMLPAIVMIIFRYISLVGRNIKIVEKLNRRKQIAVLGTIGMLFSPKLANNKTLLSHPRSPILGMIMDPAIKIIAIRPGLATFAPEFKLGVIIYLLLLN